MWVTYFSLLVFFFFVFINLFVTNTETNTTNRHFVVLLSFQPAVAAPSEQTCIHQNPHCVLAAEKQSDNKHTHILFRKTWRSCRQTAPTTYFMTALDSGCDSVFCHSPEVSIIRDTTTSFSFFPSPHLPFFPSLFLFTVFGMSVRWLTETTQFWLFMCFFY